MSNHIKITRYSLGLLTFIKAHYSQGEDRQFCFLQDGVACDVPFMKPYDEITQI